MILQVSVTTEAIASNADARFLQVSVTTEAIASNADARFLQHLNSDLTAFLQAQELIISDVMPLQT